MNGLSGKELFQHLQSIETAEQYLIARTHRELAAHKNAASDHQTMSALAVSACAAILMISIMMLAGTGNLA